MLDNVFVIFENIDHNFNFSTKLELNRLYINENISDKRKKSDDISRIDKYSSER